MTTVTREKSRSAPFENSSSSSKGFEIIITPEFEGVKPRNFLKKRLNCPYFKIPKYIKNKRITINGKKIKDDTILKKGDIIKVWLDELKMPNLKIEEKEKNKDPIEPINLKIESIYEDKNILVLNKPAGISVQGGMQKENRLINHLAYLSQKDKSEFQYFHVHRLDKQTSGVLIIAKNIETLREFNANFRERVVKKVYLCLVSGKPKKKEGEIELFLERTPQEIREKVVVTKTKTPQSKKSISIYKVLKTIEYQNEKFSLIEVEIKTGITHQIRVHMKYLNCPIIGDNMYGNSNINFFAKKQFNLNRQFLHSINTQFSFNNKQFNLKAPLLDDLKNTLKILKIKDLI